MKPKYTKIQHSVLVACMISFILIMSSCTNNRRESDWEKDDLYGRVKTIKDISFKAVERFGNIEKGDVSDLFSFLSIYNVEGNLIENYTYRSDGTLSFKKAYKYDEKRNRIEEINYESDGSINFKLTYKYDKKGNQIEENTYSPLDSLLSKKIFKYNDKGNQIEENFYKSDGSLNEKLTYKYDEKGNQIEANTFSTDGSLEYKKVYKYDEKGNQLEDNFYTNDGSLVQSYVFKYDEKGNPTELNCYGIIYKQETKWTSKYYYDKEGNWIKQIQFENEIPRIVREREIEYF